MEYRLAWDFVRKKRFFAWASTALLLFLTVGIACAEGLGRMTLTDPMWHRIVAAISAAFGTFVTIPLWLGTKRVYMTGEERDVWYFFTSPRRYFRAVMRGIVLFLRFFVFALLVMAFPAAFWFLMTYLRENPGEGYGFFARSVFLLAVLAFLLGTVLVISQAVRYLSVPYLLARDETMSVRQAVRLSAQMIKTRKMKKAWRILPLLLSGMLFFPLFFVFPFFHAVCAACVQKNTDTIGTRFS